MVIQKDLATTMDEKIINRKKTLKNLEVKVISRSQIKEKEIQESSSNEYENKGLELCSHLPTSILGPTIII